MLRGDRPGPALDGRTLDLDGPAAAAADQVVVMGVGAAAVDRLAVLGAQRVIALVYAEMKTAPSNGTTLSAPPTIDPTRLTPVAVHFLPSAASSAASGDHDTCPCATAPIARHTVPEMRSHSTAPTSSDGTPSSATCANTSSMPPK